MARRGMTVAERLADISKRSGLSEEILRRAFKAEAESAVESLKRGESATFIGRGVVYPELRNRLAVGGDIRKEVKLTMKPADSLTASLRGIEKFEAGTAAEVEEKELPSGVRVIQLSALQ